MWFQKKEIKQEFEYVIIAEFDRETINSILDERVAKLKTLLQDGYEIISAEGGLDGCIHYVLKRQTLL